MDECGSKNVIVLFHARCNDGFCAAWLFHKVFSYAQFLPVFHGQKPPDVTGKRVFILDFAYKRPIILDMLSKAESLTVIDHHKSAKEQLGDLNCCVFDMNKSGGRLAWDYLAKPVFQKRKPNIKSPWLVNYTEDRDLSKWQLPHTREVNAALSSYPMDFKVWDELEHMVGEDDLWSSRSAFVQEGAAIHRFQQRQIDTVVEQAREVFLDNHQIRAANTSVSFCDVSSRLAKNRLFGIAWYFRQDGKYVYSLHSDENGGLDVAKIAENHGGGGHRHSAGFESEHYVLKDVP